MSKLDKWIKNKVTGQQIQYDPDLWANYKAFEATQKSKLSPLWIFLLTLLFCLLCIGFLFFYSTSIHNTSEPQFVEQKSIDEVSDEPLNSDKLLSIENNNQKSTAFQKSTTETLFSEDLNAEETIPNYVATNHRNEIGYTESASYSATNTHQYNKEEPSSGLADIVPESNFIEPGADEAEKHESSNTRLNKETTATSLLASKLSLFSIDFTPKSTKDFSTLLPGESLCKWDYSYSINGGIIGYPSSTASVKDQILGAELSFRIDLEHYRAWTLSADIGLLYRGGTFGIQKDHPTLIFDFEKLVSGFQVLPTSTLYSTLSLSVGRQLGPWNIYGGMGINYLLLVSGDLYKYEVNNESLEPSPIHEEKISSGSLSKEGFKKWTPFILAGIQCNLTQNLAIGASINYFPSGLINQTHRPHFDYRTDTYIESTNNNWDLLENSHHFSIYFKYNLK